MKYGFIIAFGILWIAAPVEAQTADSMAIKPAPSRVGSPPKRGAPPTRKTSDEDPTLNKGKVTWSTKSVEMGAFLQGNPQDREIIVTNISKEPLEILTVKTSCHCTTATWTKEIIASGQTGKIWLTHDAQEVGEFYRIISIQTNFDLENWVLLSLTGEVKGL